MRLYEAETSVEIIASRYGLDPVRVIDFSLNINPFGPPPSAIEAARSALGRSNQYPDFRFGTLRRAVAARHDVEEEALFFGAGLDDVIKLLLQAWTCPDDAVLIHIPTFPRYELEARLRGCRVVAVESAEAERTDINEIRAALRAQPIALAFLCSPNNPTGEKLDVNAVGSLVADFTDTIFVVDEALIDPSEEGTVGLLRNARNAVVLRTFSKYFGLAGLRIGYAIGDPELIRIAEIGRPPFNLAGPSVDAAIAALTDKAFLAGCRATFAEERAYAVAALATLDGIRLCGANANMLLLELAGRGSATAAETLASRGIIVADATSFRGLEHRNVLRVSLRGRAENELLIEAMRALP